MKKLLCALLLALAAGVTGAAEIALQDRQIVVSGLIEDSDAEQFRTVLQEHPDATRVVFKRCLGGTLSAALTMAALIRAYRVPTLASEQCSSACAMAFLAGPERRFDEAAPHTAIVLHAGRRRDGQGPSSDAMNRRITMFLETATDGKLAPELLSLVRSSWSEAAGVMFVHRRAGDHTIDEVRYCDGTQGREADRCRVLPAFDALSQGIVTHR